MVNPPEPSANIVKYRHAEVTQLIAHLWAIPEFHLAAENAQAKIRRDYQRALAADSRLLWTPANYPPTYAIWCLALRVADPDGDTASCARIETSECVFLRGAPASALAVLLAPVVERLCQRAGYLEPTPRDRFHVAAAVLWPAASPDDLLEVVPIGPPDAAHRDSGELHLASVGATIGE